MIRAFQSAGPAVVAVVMLVILIVAAGCSPVRFVVEARSGAQRMDESTVHRDDGAGWMSPKVAQIDLTGLIVDAQRPGLLAPGENPVGRFVEALDRAADDRRVEAVIVRINSPGGTVTASDVVHREIRRFRERSGKPIVVLMADVAASGGYYAACAGDTIIAHPTSVTGSIGVIIQTVNFSEGMRRIGIRAEAITSGPNKALASPWEPMPDEHRELLQGLVDEYYANFITLVQESRPDVEAEHFDRITDGRVITGREAAAVGLVDSTGDLYDAFEAAKQLAGIEHARLVKYHRDLEHVGSPYAGSRHMAQSGGQLNLVQLNLDRHWLPDQPGFYYLWDPNQP